MAASKKGPMPLTEKQFIGEVVKRVNASGGLATNAEALANVNGALANIEGLTAAQRKTVIDALKGSTAIDDKAVAAFLRALKEEVVDCVINGYKVTFNGLCSFVPKVVAGAKAGSTKRNPSNGVVTVVKKDEPDTLGWRIGRSGAVLKQFPSLRSAAGKALHERLYVAPKKPAKKAAAA